MFQFSCPASRDFEERLSRLVVVQPFSKFLNGICRYLVRKNSALLIGHRLPVDTEGATGSTTKWIGVRLPALTRLLPMSD
jgi:hypothetical protein